MALRLLPEQTRGSYDFRVMGGGETDAQSRSAFGHGGRTDGGDVESEFGQLLRGAEGFFFRPENERMDGGGWSGIKECGELAKLCAPTVTFRSGA